MNKSQAIRLKCLECDGSPKEVTLCHIADCPLWSFRFGYSINDKRFTKRMEAAWRKYPEEYQEMLLLISEYAESMPNYHEYEQICAVLEEEEESEVSNKNLPIQRLSA